LNTHNIYLLTALYPYSIALYNTPCLVYAFLRFTFFYNTKTLLWCISFPKRKREKARKKFQKKNVILSFFHFTNTQKSPGEATKPHYCFLLLPSYQPSTPRRQQNVEDDAGDDVRGMHPQIFIAFSYKRSEEK
jgi:hypothetical protein